MSDRRNGRERIPLRAHVWCEDEEITLYVRAIDASEGGMCVRTGRTFEEGRRVRVGVSGPEGEAVVHARVAWSRPTRDTPATGLHLEEFVRGREVFEDMLVRARRRTEGLPEDDEVVEEPPEPIDS